MFVRPIYSALAAMLLAVSPSWSVRAATSPPPSRGEVVYQIFTRSMRDSNGDRIGDLKGIEQSLPYIQALGATSILLTPIYPSDFYHNYFASSFDGVDPKYGSMADFRALVADIHRRGMKIYLDEEFQYVAYNHTWLTDAQGNPGSRYADYVIWRDPKHRVPEDGPFGIRLATHFPGTVTGIATTNLASPKIRAWAIDYLRRWVDPDGDGDPRDGVDGFRLDHMMDDLDDRHILPHLFATFWTPVIAAVRATSPRVRFIAEQSGWGYGGDHLRRGGVDTVFAFPLAGAIRSLDKTKIVAAIHGTDAATPPGDHQLIFVENHDMDRTASLPGMTRDKLRTTAAIALTLKGTPLIYYGQELGMHGRFTDNPASNSDDKDIGRREAFKWAATDASPGQATWYKGNGYFWSGRFARDHDGVSVAEEEHDPASLLNLYRGLLALRRTHPALNRGEQRILLSNDPILAIERRAEKDRSLLLSNLSDRPQAYCADAVHGLAPTLLTARTAKGCVQLAPYQSALFVTGDRP